MWVPGSEKYRFVILAVSALVCCIALAVMVGWVLDIRILTSVWENYAQMTFNTALGFALISSSIFIWILKPEKNFRFLSRLLAFVAFSLGALSLYEGVFNYDLGIDQLFITDHEALAVNKPAPGRMSVATALCFTLMGLFSFLLNTHKNLYKSIGQVFLHFVTLLSFIGIVGYLYKIPAFHKLPFITSMAVHTSVSFFLLSLAASLINPSLGIAGIFTGSRIGSIMARKLFFQMTLAILILSYVRIEVYRHALMSNEFAILLFGISFILISFFLIWRASEELNKIDLEKEEVQDNLSKIKTLLDSTPDPIVIVDQQGTIHLTNNRVESVFEYLGEELEGKNIETLLPERFRNTHGNQVSSFFKAPQARAMGSNLELYALKKGGIEFPVEISLNPIDLDEEQYVAAAIRDITLRKQSEEKLTKKEQEKRRIEEILDKTNEIARIGTWELDLVSQKLTWSRVTCMIHEVQEDYEPQLGTAINFYKEGASREKIQEAMSQTLEKGTPFDIEAELVTGKKNTVWVRAIGQAEFKDGNCQRVFGMFQDINDIKHSENRLNQVNEELRAIFNSESISIIGTDKKGIITHFNHGAEVMLQYSADEMIGRKTPAVMHVEQEILKHGEELTALYGKEISEFDIFVEPARHGEYDSREWTYVRKDGSTFPVLLIVTTLKNKEGEIIGFLGIATDISEQVESQRKLKETKDDLEGLTERLTEQNVQLASFAHITSHNLRAPVSNLNSLLHFYKTAEDDEDRALLFGKFEAVIHHLSSTLNSLVEALKIREEANKSREIIQFESVLEKIKEIITGQIMESETEISSNFAQAPQINYNRGYMESIMLNLLTNAIKYRAPDRKPKISLKTEKINGDIVFTIRDNGLGIDLEKHGNKLFGLHKTFHRHKEAKGVGLFLTKAQVETMGGTISAESQVGKGTIFTIKFSAI